MPAAPASRQRRAQCFKLGTPTRRVFRSVATLFKLTESRVGMTPTLVSTSRRAAHGSNVLARGCARKTRGLNVLARNRHAPCRFLPLRRGIRARRETVHMRAHDGEASGRAGEGCAHHATTAKEQRRIVMTIVNRTTTRARDAQIIVGIEKHLQNTPSLPLGGTAYAPADLVKLIQSRIDSVTPAAAAKANWHSTVVAIKALNTSLSPVLRALREYVINVFGPASPVLADFGFAPPKRTTKTPEQKAAAAAKAKATRAARHTAGKNQKKNVKGAVTATLVVTPTGSSQPAASPAPAPATPPVGVKPS